MSETFLKGTFVSASVKKTAAFQPTPKPSEPTAFGRSSRRFDTVDYASLGSGPARAFASELEYHSALPTTAESSNSWSHNGWQSPVGDAPTKHDFCGSLLGSSSMAGSHGAGRATIGTVGGGLGVGARLYRGPTFEAIEPQQRPTHQRTQQTLQGQRLHRRETESGYTTTVQLAVSDKERGGSGRKLAPGPGAYTLPGDMGSRSPSRFAPVDATLLGGMGGMAPRLKNSLGVSDEPSPGPGEYHPETYESAVKARRKPAANPREPSVAALKGAGKPPAAASSRSRSSLTSSVSLTAVSGGVPVAERKKKPRAGLLYPKATEIRTNESSRGTSMYTPQSVRVPNSAAKTGMSISRSLEAASFFPPSRGRSPSPLLDLEMGMPGTVRRMSAAAAARAGLSAERRRDEWEAKQLF